MARLLLTGAAGMAASGLRPWLRAGGHELVLTDIRPVEDLHKEQERFTEADLTDAESLHDLMKGVDAVIHLGGHSGEQPWEEILSVNIDGTQKVLDAARNVGVGRVLLASSHHVIGFAPVGTDPKKLVPPRPDSYYGVSKAAMEALGSLYADRFGILVVAVRIGTFGEHPRGERMSHTWMSFPDLGRLVDAVLTTDASGFHLLWGVSDNPRPWFDIEPGRAIGFVPQDAATEVVPDPAEKSTTVIGGGFADHPLGRAR